MDTLPYELLEIIAGYVTPTDIPSLTRFSKKWFKICNSDRFWLNRLAQDYPQYTERLTFPIIHSDCKSINPKEMYRLLSLSLNLKNDQGEIIFRPIDPNCNYYPISLIYPSPMFGYYLDAERNSIASDIEIMVFDKYAIIITLERPSLFFRFCLDAKILRSIRCTLPPSMQQMIENEVRDYRESSYEEIDDIIVIHLEHLPRFLQEAQDKGFMECHDDYNFGIKQALKNHDELFYHVDSESDDDN